MYLGCLQECLPTARSPHLILKGSLNHTCHKAPVVPGPVAVCLVPTLLPAPGRFIHWCLLTSAGRLCLIPLGVMGVNALNDDGALLQGVARITAELHGGTHRVGRCAAAEVAIFDKGLIAVALLEGCKP